MMECIGNQMVMWRTALVVIMKTIQNCLLLETLETLDPSVKTVVMEIAGTPEVHGALGVMSSVV